MRENGVLEEMGRMREEWTERRKREKNYGTRHDKGTKLICPRNEKEMFGKEDIGNVTFIEWMLILGGMLKQWVESEKIVDGIENVILEKG
jgi:hypothetical protein